jgi:cyclic beta-1,2-glucan synthetase
VITSVDADGGALFARNAYNTDFSGRTAFFDVDAMVDEVAAQSISGNRESFLGRNGTVRNPAAMTQRRLDGIVGAALDPCAAIRVPFDLAAGQTREIVFRLGAGESLQAARELVQRWRGATAAHQAFITVKQYWQEMLGKVQVTTPDRSLDVLTNGWLLYQVMACRLWGRSWCANICCIVRRTSFRKATFSIGGIPHLGVACAPIVLMIICGYHW